MRNETQKHESETMAMKFKIVQKGFQYHGSCVKCGNETQMRDKKDGYLLQAEDGEHHVLCRHCNAYVHRVGTDEAYGIDADGDFCRTGEKFSAQPRKASHTYSPTGTQPEDLHDGSAFV